MIHRYYNAIPRVPGRLSQNQIAKIFKRAPKMSANFQILKHLGSYARQFDVTKDLPW